ncbi:hypothetical protein JTB14_024312 [Gonioctena quinquepunctata]|nr:hypothetical protein JTB14_024312 [Gonioctena quinquepunctata]
MEKESAEDSGDEECIDPNRLGASQLRALAEVFFEDESLHLDVENLLVMSKEKETENREHIFMERRRRLSK